MLDKSIEALKSRTKDFIEKLDTFCIDDMGKLETREYIVRYAVELGNEQEAILNNIEKTDENKNLINDLNNYRKCINNIVHFVYVKYDRHDCLDSIKTIARNALYVFLEEEADTE